MLTMDFFQDKTGEFVTKADQAVDLALGHMSADVERLAKMKVPVRQGKLRASGRHFRYGVKAFRVEFNTAYARKMEFVKFQNYTTPGTGAHYLENAGKTVKGKAKNYLKEAIGLIR